MAEPLGTADTAVADPLSLYSVAVGHSPRGEALREAVREGRIRLATPAVAFAVACSMRTCWDEECGRAHPGGTGLPLRKLRESGGLEIVDLTLSETLAAGHLYADCSDRRVVGPEVLAACHSVQLARSRNVSLLSTARAAYCYTALEGAGAGLRTTLV
jgi:hypothetical protein